MKFYDAHAVCKDGDKTIDMFTYTSSISLENALKVIDKWNEIYWVKEAWVDVTDTDDDNFKQKLAVNFGTINRLNSSSLLSTLNKYIEENDNRLVRDGLAPEGENNQIPQWLWDTVVEEALNNTEIGDEI